MATVTVELPRLLAPHAGGARRHDVDAATAAEAVQALLAVHPALRVHLFDEAGALRPNVLCAVDGAPTRLDGAPTPVGDGSVIVLVPSVAGG